MPKQYFDIAIVIPLEAELRELVKYFPVLNEYPTKNNYIFEAQSGSPDLKIVCVQQADMGKSHAVSATEELLGIYDVGLVICFGIAGGLSGDLKIGDVCYSSHIIDVYDNVKVEDVESGAEYRLSPMQYRTLARLVTSFNYVRLLNDLKDIYEDWQISQMMLADRLLPDGYKGRNELIEFCADPQSSAGAIACGCVSKSKSYNDKLKELDRRVLALDTESGGVFSVAARREIPAITVRGVCDYADGNKNALEASTGGKARELAAANAASFIALQIKNPRFLQIIAEFRQESRAETGSSPQSDPNDLSKISKEIEASISAKLKELSPQYRLQPDGYRLPIPRVRVSPKFGAPATGEQASSVEIREALQVHRALLLHVPRTYPDQSLGWLIAHDLFVSEVSGKQALPLVIDGSTFAPPRNGLERAGTHPLSAMIAIPGIQPVVIVEDMPFGSPTKIKFMLDELARVPEAKFVFLSRDDLRIIEESRFTDKSGAIDCSLSNISFVELIHFIEKNFQMPATEAEVVAYRLRKAFDDFDLEAHPTYFAGIPKETLAALLQANRRSELIQLAVDGFLSFVVASDKASVALSRTTRGNYLRQLVVRISVEKKSLNRSELVQFTEEFATKFDYDIEPLEFINSFVSQGVIRFDPEAKISLAFIESYLLASELSQNEEMALQYFDVEDLEFDLPAFDLYAEIGASSKVVSRIMESLARSIAVIEGRALGNPVLLSEEFQPAIMKKQDRLEMLQKQLRRATEVVKDGRAEGDQKQRLLDMVDTVRETANEEKPEALDDATKAQQNENQTALQVWVVATSLLGSGSERLGADVKRPLAAMLIKLGALVIDAWTKDLQRTDFKSFKQRVTSDEILMRLKIDLESKKDVADARRVLMDLADVFESTILSDPFRSVLHHLCENARTRVLSISLQNAEADGVIENLLKSAWVADIDIDKGKGLLEEAIKAMPSAPFLRSTLVAHLIMRVYWTHFDKEHRLKLLDIAEQALKPLQSRLKKDELKRLIERSEKDDDVVEGT